MFKSPSLFIHSHMCAQALCFCEYKSQQCRQDYIDYSTTHTILAWLFLLLVSDQDQFVFGSFLFLWWCQVQPTRQNNRARSYFYLHFLACITHVKRSSVLTGPSEIQKIELSLIYPHPANYTIHMKPEFCRRVRRPMPISFRRIFPCSGGLFLPSCFPLVSFMIRRRS